MCVCACGEVNGSGGVSGGQYICCENEVYVRVCMFNNNQNKIKKCVGVKMECLCLCRCKCSVTLPIKDAKEFDEYTAIIPSAYPSQSQISIIFLLLEERKVQEIKRGREGKEKRRKKKRIEKEGETTSNMSFAVSYSKRSQMITPFFGLKGV